MTSFQTTSGRMPAQTHAYVSALHSLKILTSLLSASNVNLQRFDNCRKKILSLPLSKKDRNRAYLLFEKAKRFVEYDEVGAVKFELNLLTRLLRNQIELHIR